MQNAFSSTLKVSIVFLYFNTVSKSKASFRTQSHLLYDPLFKKIKLYDSSIQQHRIYISIPKAWGPNEEKLTTGRPKHSRRNIKSWSSVSSIKGITWHSPSSFADCNIHLSLLAWFHSLYAVLLDRHFTAQVSPNPGVSTETRGHTVVPQDALLAVTLALPQCSAQWLSETIQKESEPHSCVFHMSKASTTRMTLWSSGASLVWNGLLPLGPLSSSFYMPKQLFLGTRNTLGFLFSQSGCLGR